MLEVKVHQYLDIPNRWGPKQKYLGWEDLCLCVSGASSCLDVLANFRMPPTPTRERPRRNSISTFPAIRLPFLVDESKRFEVIEINFKLPLYTLEYDY